MIDFRYHLVSLVAVFLALATGIVLGAGPLREELSSTLEDQVAELREERAVLRAELTDTVRRAELRSELVGELAGPAIARRLTDVWVSLVVLPGADRDVVEDVEAVVAAAGGSIATITEVTGQAEDPELAATRHEVALELAPLLEAPDPREGADPTFATVLAAALAGLDAPDQPGQWRPATWRLEELELIEVERSTDGEEGGQLPGAQDERPVDAVVVVSGGIESPIEEGSAQAQRLELRLDVVAALGSAPLPTVVVGEGGDRFRAADETPADPLVSRVRAEGAVAETVSTVDNVDTRSGMAVAVFSLAHALDGDHGHWGMAVDAEGVAPPVPPVRESVEQPVESPLAPEPSLPPDQPASTAPPGADGDRASTSTTPPP